MMRTYQCEKCNMKTNSHSENGFRVLGIVADAFMYNKNKKRMEFGIGEVAQCLYCNTINVIFKPHGVLSISEVRHNGNNKKAYMLSGGNKQLLLNGM